MTSVDDQLEEARRNLLDMSLRNKLLNFKEYKRSTAQIVDEVPSHIYRQLVLDGNSMSFLPREEYSQGQELDDVAKDEAVETGEDGTHICRLCDDMRAEFQTLTEFDEHLASTHTARLHSENDEEQSPNELEGVWELPELDQEGEDRHIDQYLQTPHGESDLQKRLYKISNRAGALIEDAGYNALHLAIGFLEWTEADAHKDPHKAPLILVPVTLDRDGAQSAFNVSWNEEELSGNLSLELKLSEQGFDLPEFDSPDTESGIREYLEAVEAGVSNLDQWEVVPEIHLGFFDFTKFIMYQDLNPDAWEAGNTPTDHPILRTLLGSDETMQEPAPFDEDQIDEELSPTDVHHVKDADPSQIAAIEDVKQGRNLVIEGPPGTGKSQTIVNMIAELVAEDKTVLFVSEKLAALDVVKDRLDSVGIGDFSLELHSDKASKSDFLDELERIANLDSYSPDIPEETFTQLEQRQRDLNAYAEALGSPVGALNRTPYALYGLQEESTHHFDSRNETMPRIDISEPESITSREHQETLSALDTLRSRLDVVAPVTTHPWQGCHPGQILPSDRRDIELALQSTLDALSDLQEVIARLESECAIHSIENETDLAEAIQAAKLLRESEPVDAEVLRNSAWNHLPPEAEELIELAATTRELQSDVGQRTDWSQPDREVEALLSEYQDLHADVLRFVRPRWYKLGQQLSALYNDTVPDQSNQVLEDLQQLVELQEKEVELQNAKSRGQALFGSLWRGAGSDPDRLREFSQWVVEFREQLLADVYSDESLSIVTRGVSEDALSETISQAEEQLDTYRHQLETVTTAVGLDSTTVFESSLDETLFSEIEEQLETLHSATGKVERWSRYDQTRKEVRATPAAPVVDLIDTGELGSDDIVPCYEGNVADALLSVAFQKRDALAQFDGQVHENRIDSFQELDQKSLQINQKRVLSKLVERSPQMLQGASKSSPAGTLFHEFGKERRHKPIRILLQEAGKLIQQMKPCFMMSPLSVAKYLEPDGIDFDVVIFDEASQVKPEDALGTILRGNQVVMLGDTKQLPPTSFFDHMVDERDSEDQWEFNIQDVESILDLCRSSFPGKRLKWHYRSRHESLIAVSNQEFYDNELLIYPSPVQDADDLGLQLNHLPDTVYDRGGSSVNREEARAVAEAAVDHYQESPSKSLGVGTFSQAQQQAVQEEIERLRKENPDVDQYFSRGQEEHFFVKNLERIQGDERDVIFISVGYGYDADGKISHNFGPLNTDGGWRRLNVLITRAREQCIVFSNFTADALDASKTSARGVKSLKVFLDYAENRNLQTLTDVGSDPDSPFERSVIKFLEQEGYEVHPQVGCAGFRVDLAIPDPENPGRYVLGIECDGASYHSSPVARARDRQRQAILEDRGWQLHRVWSTDWYRETEQTKERLCAAIEDAVERNTTPVHNQQTTEEPPDEGKRDTEANDENPTIEELQGDGAGITLDGIGKAYTRADSVPFSRLGDHDVKSTLSAVIHIVNEEGPLHRDLLAKRIIDNSDVDRQGKKVSYTIDHAIKLAANKDRIAKRGRFLYANDGSAIEVRQREDMEADIQWIPPEEIKHSLLEILRKQYETPKEDLIKQAAKVLGFSRTGARINDRVESVIDELLSEGAVTKSGDRLTVAET